MPLNELQVVAVERFEREGKQDILLTVYSRGLVVVCEGDDVSGYSLLCSGTAHAHPDEPRVSLHHPWGLDQATYDEVLRRLHDPAVIDALRQAAVEFQRELAAMPAFERMQLVMKCIGSGARVAPSRAFPPSPEPAAPGVQGEDAYVRFGKRWDALEKDIGADETLTRGEYVSLMGQISFRAIRAANERDKGPR